MPMKLEFCESSLRSGGQPVASGIFFLGESPGVEISWAVSDAGDRLIVSLHGPRWIRITIFPPSWSPASDAKHCRVSHLQSRVLLKSGGSRSCRRRGTMNILSYTPVQELQCCDRQG